MRRSGVRIPLAPPQADIRSGCRFFVCLGALVWCLSLCCLWRRWCSGRSVVMLCGALPLCVPVGGGPPARSPHASCARSGRSRGPPWPCRHPPAPRLGPVTAHGHHSLTPPPTGTAAGPHRRPRAPQPGSAAPTGTAVPSGPSGALHSRLLSLTGGAGNSRETVITVAGVCFASGETDDTIASQIHLFLVLFHRAKASWVSWRRPDVSALVPTVSSRGAVSSIGVTKFAQRRLSMAVAPNHSPSAGKMAQNGRL